MALVTFRSKAAGEIYMFQENARRVFEILGRAEAERGVITAAQLDDAIGRLSAAVDAEKAQLAASRKSGADDEPAGARAISLGQRVYPLLEMLRAAKNKQVDVTWGV